MILNKICSAQKIGVYEETSIDIKKKYSDFLILDVSNGKKILDVKNDFLLDDLKKLKRGVKFYNTNIVEVSAKNFENINNLYFGTINF